ncbi:hypothetical protein [Planctobacterium marinum]|uniref:hypothetical protein n=1 Tax=Planctobacterium marinum TaxID=1631968 RepID=UPI001E4A68F6|nr:hypothetical protein [Planctobacterium marinum]MCC2604885.1 hypothetical protein [Planctobacterium marinum]
MTTLRRLLMALLPLQSLFTVTALLTFLSVLYVLLLAGNDYQSWLLPLVMLFAWSASIAFTLQGHRFLQGVNTPQTFWQKIKLKLVTGLVRLLELLFMLTCAILLWLSVRALGMLF